MLSHDKPRVGMVVVAHADDAEWGCSGTVALWCKEGMEVVYVICTDGTKGSDDLEMTSVLLAQIRRDEQSAASSVLGVKNVVFLGYEDSMLQPTIELRKDIVRQIRRYRPNVLITSSPNRTLGEGGYIGHPDHMAVGEAALAAIFPSARDRLTFPDLLEEGLEPHKVEELLVMPGRQTADMWVDVTETIDLAIQALQQHKSQVEPESAARHMREWREEVGKPRGMPYAEAFKRFLLPK